MKENPGVIFLGVRKEVLFRETKNFITDALKLAFNCFLVFIYSLEQTIFSAFFSFLLHGKYDTPCYSSSSDHIFICSFMYNQQWKKKGLMWK